MSDERTRDANDLGKRLLEAEGLRDPDAMKRRREAMRQILEEERAFTRRIRRASLTAWALSVLMPLGFIGQRVLVFLSSGPEGPLASHWVMYMGVELLTFVGGFAAVIGVITLVAWLFRTRTASLATLQLRLGDLEEELAALRQERARS